MFKSGCPGVSLCRTVDENNMQTCVMAAKLCVLKLIYEIGIEGIQ